MFHIAYQLLINYLLLLLAFPFRPCWAHRTLLKSSCGWHPSFCWLYNCSGHIGLVENKAPQSPMVCHHFAHEISMLWVDAATQRPALRGNSRRLWRVLTFSGSGAPRCVGNHLDRDRMGVRKPRKKTKSD